MGKEEREALHFGTRNSISGLTRRAQTAMLLHPCPGNVRDLENVISSACITGSGEFIDLADLPERLQWRNCLHSHGKQLPNSVPQYLHKPLARTPSRV